MGASSGFEGQPMFFQLGILVWVFWQDVELARNRWDLAQWLQSVGGRVALPRLKNSAVR
jgi:hypothetical protein